MAHELLRGVDDAGRLLALGGHHLRLEDIEGVAGEGAEGAGGGTGGKLLDEGGVLWGGAAEGDLAGLLGGEEEGRVGVRGGGLRPHKTPKHQSNNKNTSHLVKAEAETGVRTLPKPGGVDALPEGSQSLFAGDRLHGSANAEGAVVASSSRAGHLEAGLHNINGVDEGHGDDGGGSGAGHLREETGASSSGGNGHRNDGVTGGVGHYYFGFLRGRFTVGEVWVRWVFQERIMGVRAFRECKSRPLWLCDATTRAKRHEIMPQLRSFH